MGKNIIEAGKVSPNCSYEGIKLKQSEEDVKPEIQVIQEGSDGRRLKVALLLPKWEKQLDAAQDLPLVAALRGRLFDLESFYDGSWERDHPFTNAVEHVLNSEGALHFFPDENDEGCVQARFEFRNNYIYFYFDEEESKTYFEKS